MAVAGIPVAAIIGLHGVVESEQQLEGEMAADEAAYNAEHPFPECEE